MHLDNTSEFYDALDENHILHILLALCLQHGLIIVVLAGVEHNLFRTLAKSLPQQRAECNCLYISDLLALTDLIWLTIAEDPLTELGPNAHKYGQHLDAMHSHEALMVEYLERTHYHVAQRRLHDPSFHQLSPF